MHLVECSARAPAPTYGTEQRSAHRETPHPIVSGGAVITGWAIDDRGRWHARLPQVAAGQWNFCQLFVAGQRRLRPRLPKGNKYFYIAGEVAPTEASAGKGCDRFQFNPGEI